MLTITNAHLHRNSLSRENCDIREIWLFSSDFRNDVQYFSFGWGKIRNGTQKYKPTHNSLVVECYMVVRLSNNTTLSKK